MSEFTDLQTSGGSGKKKKDEEEDANDIRGTERKGCCEYYSLH